MNIKKQQTWIHRWGGRRMGGGGGQCTTEKPEGSAISVRNKVNIKNYTVWQVTSYFIQQPHALERGKGGGLNPERFSSSWIWDTNLVDSFSIHTLRRRSDNRELLIVLSCSNHLSANVNSVFSAFFSRLPSSCNRSISPDPLSSSVCTVSCVQHAWCPADTLSVHNVHCPERCRLFLRPVIVVPRPSVELKAVKWNGWLSLESGTVQIKMCVGVRATWELPEGQGCNGNVFSSLDN